MKIQTCNLEGTEMRITSTKDRRPVISLFGDPNRKRLIREKLAEETKDDFRYSKPKMALLWGAGAGVSALAGVGIAKAWETIGLPVNSQLVGMAIGGAVGAASTYFALGDQVNDKVRLGATLAAGAAGAAAWNHFHLNGLKEGLGMAVGSAIGIAVGHHSVPEKDRGLLTGAALGTLGMGLFHVGSIVGATGTPLGAAGAALFPIIGGTAGWYVASGLRTGKAEEIASRI